MSDQTNTVRSANTVRSLHAVPDEPPPRIVDNRGKRRGIQGLQPNLVVVDEAAKVRTCRICHCTDEQACDGGCGWVADDLCSRCEARINAQVVVQQRVADDAARRDRIEEIRAANPPEFAGPQCDLLFLLDEVDRLRAGDDITPVRPGTWPTAGQWLQHLSEQDEEGRLQLAGRALEDAQELYAINAGMAQMQAAQQAEQFRSLFGRGNGGLVIPE